MKLYLSLFLLVIPLFCIANNEKWEERLNQLDQSLEKKKLFEHEKLEKIKRLKGRLKTISAKDRFEINRQLFKEYSSYQYDSAYVYANHLLSEARKLKNPDYEVEAHCDLVFCLLSAGLYTEAFNELHSIHTEGTNPFTMTYLTIHALNPTRVSMSNKQVYILILCFIISQKALQNGSMQ